MDVMRLLRLRLLGFLEEDEEEVVRSPLYPPASLSPSPSLVPLCCCFGAEEDLDGFRLGGDDARENLTLLDFLDLLESECRRQDGIFRPALPLTRMLLLL